MAHMGLLLSDVLELGIASYQTIDQVHVLPICELRSLIVWLSKTGYGHGHSSCSVSYSPVTIIPQILTTEQTSVRETCYYEGMSISMTILICSCSNLAGVP